MLSARGSAVVEPKQLQHRILADSPTSPSRNVAASNVAARTTPHRSRSQAAGTEGTYAVGLGLLVSGITAYGFQILAFKGLSKAEYAALNGLWIFVFVVAPGFFLPLEQEVGRAVADRRSRALGGGPVVRTWWRWRPTRCSTSPEAHSRETADLVRTG